MAFLIPANLATRPDVPRSLRQAAQAFRDWLDNDVTVTLHPGHTPETSEAAPDPHAERREPRSGDDQASERPWLVVIHPAVGIVFVDFAAGRDARALTRRLRSQAALRRLADEAIAALGERRDEVVGRLVDHGFESGQAPVALAVAAPSVARADIAGGAGGDRSDLCGFLLREDLSQESVETALARVVEQASGRLFDGGRVLDTDDQRRVRATVNPRLIVQRTARSEQGNLVFLPPPGDEDTTAVLDRQQEQLAWHMGGGYRVVKGVAGSGKTLVLVFRARQLAFHYPHRRVLLTCFNRPLAHELSRQLADCVNVDVRTVDSLAWKLCEAAGISANGTGSDQYDRPIREALAALDDDRIADEHKYDAILLDEAQDLDESRTRLAFSALRHPWNDFVVAIDAAQNLYRRSPGLPPPARHPPGSLDTTQITGRGRTEVLRRNYRNTREILKFADDFLRAGGAPEAGDDDDPTAFVPPETAARSGPPVDVRRFQSDTAALEAVATALQRSHDEGIAWSDMAVLSGNKTALSDMANLIEEMGVPTLDLRDRKRGAPRPRGEVRLSTLQLAKGLEFARVYIMGVDDIKGGPGTDETLQRRLLYVGMTRATEQLKIAMSGTGPIIEALHSAKPPRA